MLNLKQILSSVALGAMLLTSTQSYADLLVETETFDQFGGWKADHQAFPKIQSAYIQAHGMGRPVKDATKDIKFDKAGKYHVYVSAYNWTSPWHDGRGPGSFQVLVDGKPLYYTLGDHGDKWEWQYAGAVEVGTEATVALHDLTGYHGRADAIYFSESQTPPPSDLEEQRKFRLKKLGYEKTIDCGDYDLVVAGAGIAGLSTALTAARYGLKVALVDNLPALGGNHYLGVTMNGLLNKNKYPQIGNMVRQLSCLPIPQTEEEYLLNAPHIEHTTGAGKLVLPMKATEMAVVRKEILEEAGVDVYNNIYIYKVNKDKKGKISEIIGKSMLTGEESRYGGKYFADCTGDGVVGYLAGADYRMGRESRDVANESFAPDEADSKMMGITMWWGSAPSKDGKKVDFPKLSEMPWALPISEEYHLNVTGGGWFWETGLEINNAEEAELVRDNMFRAIYSNFAYLKEHYAKYETYQLGNITNIGMKRESRRLMGDVILNQNDVLDHVEYPDASFTTTWPLDLHYATKDNSKHFPGWEFITECPNDDPGHHVLPAYDVPYRVLYSRNIDNLFVGGRCMSVTHVALGTVRVQVTLGMAGEVAGMAAKICVDNDVTPRGVYENHLDKLKEYMAEGAPLE